MRHRRSGVKLNRSSSHRQAMFRNMVTSLLKHDRIKTTDVRAKELRRWADRIITLAKRGDLHARRQALAIVREKAVVHKIFAEANERFGRINGGYTRIVKLGRRPGDAAPISIIELVSADEQAKKKKKKTAARKKTAAPVVEPQETKAGTSEPPAAEEAVEAQTEAAQAEATVEERGDGQAEAVDAQAEKDTEAAPEAAVEAAPGTEATPEPAAQAAEKKDTDPKTE